MGGGEGDGLMAPVDHVRRYGVAPVHVTPNSGVGIELIEEVIFALPEDRAVGVVHPVVGREEMEGGAMGVVGDVVDGGFSVEGLGQSEDGGAGGKRGEERAAVESSLIHEREDSTEARSRDQGIGTKPRRGAPT